MPAQRKPESAARRKSARSRASTASRMHRKPHARKRADRPLRRTPGLLPEIEEQPSQRGRRAVDPPLSQEQLITPLIIWKVYRHPEDYPGEYVAKKFVITEDFYVPNGSISSRSLRDVRNVLRSLYRGLTQLKRPPDDEPHIVEVWL